MGTAGNNRIECAHCAVELSPEHTGLCPACGKEGKLTRVAIKSTLRLKSSLNWEMKREYYEKNKLAMSTVILITIISPFIGSFLAGPFGVVAGIIVGIISYFLGPIAITKIIEKTKGHS